MGDTEVRAAVVDFFKAPAIPGIQGIYKDEPWFLDGGKWSLKDNGGWGAVGFVHLDTSNSHRIAVGGADANGTPTGQVMEMYTVSLVLQYKYLIPKQLADGMQEDAWVGPLDQIIDDVKTRIRSDPTFGTGPGGVIYQAGQGDGSGGPLIRQSRDLPVTNQQRTQILSWNRIEFDARSILTA
jgi:hypothetical protein